MSKLCVSGGGSGKFVVVRGDEKLEVDQNLTAYQAAHEIAAWINGPDLEVVPEGILATGDEAPKGKAKK